MRTNKRNWLLVLLVVGAVIFGMGWLSNRQTPEASAAVDTRTAMERYVSAYALYTDAMLDRFEAYQSAVVRSDWDLFWSMLLRVSFGTAVILGGYSGFRFAQAKLDGISNRSRLVSTPYMTFWIDTDSTGKKVPRPIDKPFEEPAPAEKQVETIPVYHNGEAQVIEVNKDGKVIDVVVDAEDFLSKAIKASKATSNELPRHETMGVSAERWSSMVHDVLGGMFTVENRGGGVKTYCTAYPDLASTYYAVKTKKVPLPEKKKTKK